MHDQVRTFHVVEMALESEWFCLFECFFHTRGAEDPFDVVGEPVLLGSTGPQIGD